MSRVDRERKKIRDRASVAYRLGLRHARVLQEAFKLGAKDLDEAIKHCEESANIVLSKLKEEKK